MQKFNTVFTLLISILFPSLKDAMKKFFIFSKHNQKYLKIGSNNATTAHFTRGCWAHFLICSIKTQTKTIYFADK